VSLTSLKQVGNKSVVSDVATEFGKLHDTTDTTDFVANLLRSCYGEATGKLV